MSLITVKLKRCVKKLSLIALLCQIVSLIAIQIKKFVKNIVYINIMLIKMYGKAINVCLRLLKFVPGWFVKNRMVKDIEKQYF